MVKRKKRYRSRLPAPLHAGAALEGLLESMGGSRSKSRLSDLWEKWGEICGSELAALATPLGCHKDILIIGAHDAMQMQELHFMSAELLRAANSFLQCDYFREVRINLTGSEKRGKKRPAPVPVPRQEIFAAPAPSGKYLADMDRNSPVARCYALFARLPL